MDMIAKFFSSIYNFLIAWGEVMYEYRKSQANRIHHY
jgi:hypothetical protein